MKIALDQGTASYRIRGYGPGRVTINETEYTRDLIVLPEALIEDWESVPAAELTVEHFAALADHDPEILLLGTGAGQHLPPARLLAHFARRGIGLEAMDTAAACRTYNVLMSEDRRVAAALMMIEAD
ncbi:MAG: Mth938-like domain-containing protein [Halofilum sp. (in: g-proteobacteria)]|nr:Mth938-like domain-containing protein [Halofilum sp. (in: g-proteobacteria)]